MGHSFSHTIFAVLWSSMKNLEAVFTDMLVEISMST